MNTTGALFEVDTVANYLYGKKPDISPLKLQKSLYFLFAYHGAYYTEEAEEGVLEGSIASQNKYLFNAEFQAWKFGPVIREVYFRDRDGLYGSPEEIAEANIVIGQNPEAKKFIDELFEQIDAVSDFTLVDRSHEDWVWKKAFAKNQSTPMNSDEIIKEYSDRYVTL
ncbi:Panacea domain-containing protein [Paenibacillus pasadenensis]|uniref:Panacea domain-containing protein n=1 Tax=Paenibacillus TaxID=44249 RepID=UPI00040D0C15|nr:type II toxin-antitoxin system antitoxin SocA domain-containing protein [Paenibacillus pasadenensis]